MKLRRAEPMPLNNDMGYDKGQFEIVPWNESPTNEYGFTWVNPKCKFDRCFIRIRKGEPKDGPDGVRRHGWDGNRDAPTITPSIGCDQRCGWHGNINNGESNP